METKKLISLLDLIVDLIPDANTTNTTHVMGAAEFVLKHGMGRLVAKNKIADLIKELKKCQDDKLILLIRNNPIEYEIVPESIYKYMHSSFRAKGTNRLLSQTFDRPIKAGSIVGPLLARPIWDQQFRGKIGHR